MPISIGLAPTKTLAKIASKLAKKFEAYRHCCMIDTDYKREKALEWCPIEDVWGIGRRYAARLQALGCKTALDFAKLHESWVQVTFNNINIVRTWRELNGIGDEGTGTIDTHWLVLSCSAVMMLLASI